MEESRHISSIDSLKSIIAFIKLRVSNNEFEVLYEKGLNDNTLDNFVEGIYYDYSKSRIRKLSFKINPDSMGEWKTIKITSNELNTVLKADWKYSLKNYSSKFFIFSCLLGTTALYEIHYPMNQNEVEKYLKNGEIFLDKLYTEINMKSPMNVKRKIEIQQSKSR